GRAASGAAVLRLRPGAGAAALCAGRRGAADRLRYRRAPGARRDRGQDRRDNGADRRAVLPGDDLPRAQRAGGHLAMKPDAAPRLIASRLSVLRSRRIIVADADLALNAGELTILAGPNGAGKTTLARAMAGLLACKG